MEGPGGEGRGGSKAAALLKASFHIQNKHLTWRLGVGVEVGVVGELDSDSQLRDAVPS